MAILIDGKALAEKVCSSVAEEVKKLKRIPCLAAVLVGEDPASQIYVRNKEKDCAKCGIESRRYDLPDTTTQEELLALVSELNSDDTIDGILVQLPLPKQIDESIIIEAIDPRKDIDAFHPYNVGKMITGEPLLWPCTPGGIMKMFEEYNISLDGKVCVMVGRSNIVGRPMGLLMLKEHGTVIYCNRHTPDLGEMTRQADILVVAAGCPNLISGDMVKDGVVVIDVAMNRNPDTGKFFGDVIFDEVEKKASYISPVPGGVGPMTRAMLMENILTAAKINQSGLKG